MVSFLVRVVVVAVLVFAPPAIGQDAASQSQAAWNAAYAARTEGPADVPLGAQAVLHLPRGFLFLPLPEAKKLMESFGNSVGPGFMGVVSPADPQSYWLITVDFEAEGFVKDEEAMTWDKTALLQNLKDGTEAQNQHRTEMGIPALHVLGWIEEPAYDAATHRLVWSISAREEGAAADAPKVVNYNTYALGRDGYFELDLLTDEAHIAADKGDAATVLASLEYNHGRRYQDYVAGTDKVASYGIAALVGGLAAKKLGLLAVVGVFLAKFAKLGLFALVAAGAGVTRLFRRKGGGGA